MEKWLIDARKRIKAKAEMACIECIAVAEEQDIELYYVIGMFVNEFRNLEKNLEKLKERYYEMYGK